MKYPAPLSSSLTKLIAIMVGLLALLTGCHCAIYEDLSDCPQGIVFSFDIRYPGARAYDDGVREIRLFAFDEQGKLISEIKDSPVKFSKDYSLTTDLYRPGEKLTFVTWAGADLSQYDFAGFTPGTSLTEMTVALAHQGAELGAKASPLFVGTTTEPLLQQERVGTVMDSVHISMEQLTNRVYFSISGLDPERQYTIHIGAANSRYAGTGKLLPEEPFTYLPADEICVDGTLEADFDILKLDPSLAYPVEVIDKETSEVVYSLDLIDLIARGHRLHPEAPELLIERNHNYEILINLQKSGEPGTYMAIQAFICEWNVVSRDVTPGA